MVKKIIEEQLEERFKQEDLNDCFLIEINEHPANKKLEVYVDSDSGMSLKKCSTISRYLHHFIEENNLMGESFKLEVSSPGIDRPLSHKRQFVNNLGRLIRVKLHDGNEIRGKLASVQDDNIEIAIPLNKKEAKKKGIKEEQVIISFDNVHEAKIEISFK